VFRFLVQHGVFKIIFSNLAPFKEYDPVVAEVYGSMNATYNMMYFYDCLETLDNILLRGSTADNIGLVAGAFDRECISKVDLLATDIRQCAFDIRNLSEYNCNLVEVLKNFILHIRDCHGRIKTELLTSLVTLCNLLLHNLNEKVNSAIESYKAKVLMAIIVMEVACFSELNFPKGDNRIFQARSDISLIELIMKVENCYRISTVTLTYFNESNERIMINSDIALKRAIYDAYKDSVNKGKTIIRFIVGLPINIESTDLTIDSFRAEHPTVVTGFAYAFDSWTDLKQKDALLTDLKRCTGFSIAELSTIYYAFYRITQRRLLQKDKGYVSLPEFTDLMSKQ
jgi:hypothetical protein